jgi:arylsulfatase A-like enzyme
MTRSPLLLILALGLQACGGQETRPDIILLTVDTLRADNVSAYNPNSRARTPHIDSLAAEGIRFERAYSPISVTGPAFCSMHTGRRPGLHGVVLNIFRGGTPLPSDVSTLAQALKAQGYSTGAFVSGFTLRPELGLDRGFDTYEWPEALFRPGEETAAAAVHWLQAQEGPVFLWFHSFDPHGPLRKWPNPKPRRSWERSAEKLARIASYQRVAGISDPTFYAERYASAVEYADRQVGQLLDALRQTQRMDSAVIVFNADHGESFDERDLWFDHGTTAFEEQLHIPLIIRLPGAERAGEVQPALVSLQDVAPTLLHLIGAPALEGADGRADILTGGGHSVLTGESSHCKEEQGQACAPTGHAGKMFVARDETRAVVRRSTVAGVVYEYYDRIGDPGERRPLSGSPPPADLKALVDAMADERARMGLSDPGVGDLSPEEAAELEALQALGYADGGSEED